MDVLVDTSVWSLAFRKKSIDISEKKIVSELKELILEKRVIMIGPIKQELLSGISNISVYEKLKIKINSFEDENLVTRDYLKAAEIHNECRRNGIQGSHIDFLIVATAINRNWEVFTTDKDFKNYSKFVELKLHKIREQIRKL